MICENCGKQTYKKKYYYTFSKIIERCSLCPNKHTPPKRLSPFVKIVNINSKGTRTVAHDEDISRRRLASDGRTVYRHYERKYFTMP